HPAARGHERISEKRILARPLHGVLQARERETLRKGGAFVGQRMARHRAAGQECRKPAWSLCHSRSSSQSRAFQVRRIDFARSILSRKSAEGKANASCDRRKESVQRAGRLAGVARARWLSGRAPAPIAGAVSIARVTKRFAAPTASVNSLPVASDA